MFGMLVAADNKRSEEREERLTQATASIPSAIFWFLLATLVITVVALSICMPRRNIRGQLITITVITALLTTTLCIIRDVDALSAASSTSSPPPSPKSNARPPATTSLTTRPPTCRTTRTAAASVPDPARPLLVTGPPARPVGASGAR